MAGKKFSSFRRKLREDAHAAQLQAHDGAADDQVPDDDELERSVDNDEQSHPNKDRKLPIKASDADDQKPEQKEVPAPDADPKDLEPRHKSIPEHIVALANFISEEEDDLDEEDDKDLDEDEDKELDEDEDELEEDEDKELDEDEDELDEAEDSADEITKSDLEESEHAKELTDIEMHNRIEDDEDGEILDEEEDKELDEEDDDDLDEEDDKELDEEKEKELDEEEDEELEEEEDSAKEKKKDLEEMRKTIALLTKGSSLSKEAKKKIGTLFEAAVNERVSRKRQKIEKLYTRKLKESKEKILHRLVNKLDTYHSHVVDEWLQENKLAVQKGIRTEIAESFISGLKTLFEEHNINLPESKGDVLDQYAQRAATLEKQLNEQINKNMKERATRRSLEKELVLREACADLSENQADKLRRLTESVSFTNKNDFSEKVSIICENFFEQKKVSKKGKSLDENLLKSGGLKNGAKAAKSTDPTMSFYSQVIDEEVKED